MSKIKYRFERLLSVIYAAGSHKNNQQVRIVCLKPRPKKNKFECKHCGCTNFYMLDYQNSPFGDVLYQGWAFSYVLMSVC